MDTTRTDLTGGVKRPNRRGKKVVQSPGYGQHAETSATFINPLIIIVNHPS